jgi:hypothetical protein
MATVEKDFKVKNGLIVALGGTFGGTVTVATPTEAQHAATKQYVDEHNVVEVADVAPEIIRDGQFYFNPDTYHLSVSYEDEWIVLGNFMDTINLPQHIHDTSIGGNGLMVTIFQDAGFYYEVPLSFNDAGSYNQAIWEVLFDGGIAVDNFN